MRKGKIRVSMVTLFMVLFAPGAMADENVTGSRQILSLQECRDRAVENNKELKIAQQKIVMAGYDRKTAFANYFPNVSVTAAYMYNSRNLALVDDNLSNMLTGTGPAINNAFQQKIDNILNDPVLGQIILNNPAFREFVGQLQATDIAAPITAIGNSIDDFLHPDIENMFVGVANITQPVFMGGKIVNANRIAGLAEELSKSQYETQYQEVIISVDKAYWQIVAVANKVKLAEEFASLLHTMEHDVDIMIEEGVATESDRLTVKVKANEADMLYTKATNGLALAKMLLCQLCGMDLDSDISLEDETSEFIPLPQISPYKDLEEIADARPELHSLDLATQIYTKKVAVARADMMPTVALTGNYLLTNPNLFNGWEKKFNGMFNVGVMVKVPIVHGGESMMKLRKAKAEAVMMNYRYEDTKEMVALQVSQLRKQEAEALQRMNMAESNLENSEENLRVATIGFNEGIVTANTVLQAQTAWLQAHSEYIDSGVELQICCASRKKAEGYSSPVPEMKEITKISRESYKVLREEQKAKNN